GSSADCRGGRAAMETCDSWTTRWPSRSARPLVLSLSTDERRRSWFDTLAMSGLLSFAELRDVFVVSAGQKIEKRIEAAIEGAAKLGDRAVDCVEGESCRRSVGERQRGIVDALQRTFRNQTDAIDKGVASHLRDLKGRTVERLRSAIQQRLGR